MTIVARVRSWLMVSVWLPRPRSVEPTWPFGPQGRVLSICWRLAGSGHCFPWSQVMTCPNGSRSRTAGRIRATCAFRSPRDRTQRRARRAVVARRAVDDVVAVMDAAGSRTASVLATGWGGPIGIRLAVRHRDRVDRLVLVNTWARWAWATDYPIGERREETQERIAGVDPKSAGDSDLAIMAPMLAARAPGAALVGSGVAERGASPAVIRRFGSLSAALMSVPNCRPCPCRYW